RAVLADERMHFTGRDREVDVFEREGARARVAHGEGFDAQCGRSGHGWARGCRLTRLRGAPFGAEAAHRCPGTRRTRPSATGPRAAGTATGARRTLQPSIAIASSLHRNSSWIS